jgi:hypothetical protein
MTRLAALTLALGGFVFAPPGAAAADSALPTQDLSLPQYIARLRGASETLEGRNPDSIHAFRDNLPSQWMVHSGGELLPVDTDWLAKALSSEERNPSGNTPELQRAREHLAALREAADELASPAASPDLARSRKQVERILSDPDFQSSREATSLDKLKKRVSTWISQQLGKIFGRIGISAAAGDTIAWIVIALAAIPLAFWAMRALIAAATRSEMDLRGAAPAGHDWRHWAEEARAAAERGDYRAAIHASYWAAVARLEESSLLPADRSRTPRESLRLVDGASEVHAPLLNLTRRLEWTWYGYRAATPADWDDAMQQLEKLGCLRSSMPATAGS